jgi:ABC-2 type transport system ATP-binding protein
VWSFPYERGLSIFLLFAHAPHILTDLERVALDVAFLKGGRIALQGPLDELLEGARNTANGRRAEPLSLEDLFIEVTREVTP